jgi:heme-degrading monooxygenase HmoA
MSGIVRVDRTNREIGLLWSMKTAIVDTMKRPIAELLTITVKAGAEADRAQYEHEAWQILRRKQGYVTHRIYVRVNDPLQRLEYSEWESKKAVDGARQYVQGTPLMRRARAALAAAPQRLIVEPVGPVTSTKGIELPEQAVAASAVGQVRAETGAWRTQQEALWKALSGQPGHLAHLLFQGFETPLLVGSLSHWTDAAAFERALAACDTASAAGDALAAPFSYVVYRAAIG